MSKVRTPCLWVGGKSRLSSWITQQLPEDCQTYVEPFGGSAAILLNRHPCEVEVYNDLDGALVTFMLCVKNHYEELCREIRDIPYSREIFQGNSEWMRYGCPGRMTDIQFAARWWYLNLLSFGARMSSFGTATSTSRTQQFIGRQYDLYSANKRLLNVLIEQDDFRKIINRYDSDNTLFYCDPPYVDAEKVYEAIDRFTEQDHIDLADMLSGIQGRAAISYYPHPIVDELYPAKLWQRVARKWTKSIAGTTRDQRKKKTRRPKSVEMLLMNYDPKTGERLNP